MQKTFIKYTFIVITAGIFLILVINLLFTWHTLELSQFHSFCTKIDQVIHTLESNQTELKILQENLDEDYLTRARAAEYVLDRQKEVSLDVSEMQYLANLLNVDELHVIDENGIIVSASVSQYVGIDMSDHPQTSAFLALLESDNENDYLIQEAQPNAAESKIMQYVGVARKSTKGVVQVGFEPTRQLEAQSRNTYEYIFAQFPTDVSEELFVVDRSSGAVLGHSDGINQLFSAEYYQLEPLLDCKNGAFLKVANGKSIYVVSQSYADVLICAALPANILFQKLLRNTVNTFIYLLLIEAAAILVLNFLVKRKVIDGIHSIINDLSAITQGILDTTVVVGGNREFEKLSDGINTMVKSIIRVSDRISAIIEISGVPLAAFEYENGANPVFITSGLKDLLDIDDKQASILCQNATLFDHYIHRIMEHPIDGESDIFKMSDAKYIRIHMSKSAKGYLGVITDVSKDIIEKLQMHYENTHDALTGLYKFRYFKDLASEKIQQMPAGKLCAVVMIDLDYFKSINDTFGHDIGDRYLQHFSATMHSMPQEHFLTARRSGDEFCMMIYDCADKAEIIRYLNMFYEAIGNAPVALSDSQSKIVSASCGYAWTDNRSADISELLSHADEALYEVKKETKGRYAEYALLS